MKRIVAAAICGFAIALIFASIGRLLSNFTDSEALKWLLWVPVGWPTLILAYFLPTNAIRIRDEYRSAILIYIVAANVLLYGLFSYFVLLGLSLSGKSRQAQNNVPPPPTLPQ